MDVLNKQLAEEKTRKISEYSPILYLWHFPLKAILEKLDVKKYIDYFKYTTDNDLMFAGYNPLVTSETQIRDQDIYKTYHNLWRIEESFRVMKSDMDARPAFWQREDTIKGHFLICYLIPTLAVSLFPLRNKNKINFNQQTVILPYNRPLQEQTNTIF